MTTYAFDLDGTLLDSRARHCGLAEWCARRAGITVFDPDRHWSLKREGLSTRQALERAGVDATRAGRISEAWIAHIEDDRWIALDTLLPGALAALTDVHERGSSAVVLTARRRADAAERQLADLGLLDLVSDVHVVDPSNAASQKATVLRRLGPSVFVGDTESDAEAAARSSIPFVAVTTGMRNRAWLERLGVMVTDDLAAAIARH